LQEGSVVFATSARLLALLALLPSRPTWTGAELAEQLDVTVRTVRNDIERLRGLDYPIEAARGRSGHYRLGAGGRLPPLLLDDEEAIAVAVGLRVATGVAGVEDSGARALLKLEQVLPHRLRRTVAAINSAVSRGPENTTSNAVDPQVDPADLAVVARAIRDGECLHLRYDDASTLVEPYRLVSWQRRWFLVGRQPPADRWLVLRLDRMTGINPAGRRFDPRPLPEQEYTELVVSEVAAAGWQAHARITVRAPAEQVLARINPAVGVVEPVDDQTCVLLTGGDTLETIAVYIGMLGLDFHVDGPPELVRHLAVLGERYMRSTQTPEHKERD